MNKIKLPSAKNADILVQIAGKEMLVYNLTNHKAFNLNETSTIVYQSCDGKATFEYLKRKHKFSDDLIYFALDELKKNDLLENYQIKFEGVSRREIIKRVGLASMIALPIVSSLIAPTAVAALSVCGGNCTCSNENFFDEFTITCRFGLGGTSNCPTASNCDCIVAAGISNTAGTCDIVILD